MDMSLSCPYLNGQEQLDLRVQAPVFHTRNLEGIALLASKRDFMLASSKLPCSRPNVLLEAFKIFHLFLCSEVACRMCLGVDLFCIHPT